MRQRFELSGMKNFILVLLLLPMIAFAQSDEDKIYDALKGSVRTTDRPFTIFHWEKAETDFSKKFNLEEPRGLTDMVQAASRSFVEQDAKHGFYAATDPVVSRAFGMGNWRLIQMEVPEGWKYLDISMGREDVMDRLAAAFPEDGPCLSSMLVSNNNGSARFMNPTAFNFGRCNALKQKVFRRLGVSGVRYIWVPSTLDKYCRGKDRSAFVITNGSWLNAKNVKAYTVDSRGNDPDRKAVHELVRNIRPPMKYKKTVPVALWKDLPADAPISDATKEWMNKKLLNCSEMGAAAEEDGDDSSDEDTITGPAK
jgi:hypothetical protein